ncbi:MAG: hypothetical protein JRJ59_12020 [Deltaproteobacteria bacterium]|nr:hypothetical protein [Deltaproteobacteria bacterium]
MFRGKDLILLSVVGCSAAAGLTWPSTFSWLAPALSYLMMGMLFLSFLKIEPIHVWRAIKDRPGQLILLGGVKLILLPALVYPLASWLSPDYALGLLLLAGASTGVTTPFFTAFIGGNVALAMIMASATSLLVPLSLPLMVRLLAGRELNFSLIDLALLLAMIIFLPLTVVWVCRRFWPWIINQTARISFPVSLVILGLMILGAFGQHASYLRGNPEQFLVAGLLAVLLGLLLGALGWFLLKAGQPPDRVAAAGSMIWSNNILVIVIGTELGDVQTLVLAAIYMGPIFAAIPLLARLAKTGHT